MSFENRSTAPELLIHVLREGLTESIHHCQAVVADSRGRSLAMAGNSTTPVFARSALKPFQALAMLSTGIRDQDLRWAKCIWWGQGLGIQGC